MLAAHRCDSPCVQDVSDSWSFEFPQLYVPGQLNLCFSKTAFVKCALHSCYCSLVLFFIPYGAMYDTVRYDGKDVADYQSFALLTQTCLVIAVCIQVCVYLLVLLHSPVFTYFSNSWNTVFNADHTKTKILNFLKANVRLCKTQ